MSKVICEICGTSYPDTQECCPICGCSREAAADLLNEDILAEEAFDEPTAKASKKPIFDFDEVNAGPATKTVVVDEEIQDFDDEDEGEEEEASRPNTLIVIILTVLIIALLAAGGFVFVKYFLPNMKGQEEPAEVPTTAATAAPTQATEKRIPCDTLFLNSTKQAELTQPGFSHLINVVIYPENTTDTLTFTSADESVATVTSDGKITAVGPGETAVTIRCGDIEMQVNVVCAFAEETEPATEAAEETAPEGETTPEEETAPEGETDSEEEAPAEEDSRKEVDPSIVLKLKKTDITVPLWLENVLELDCDLDPKDVEWSSEHAYIAKVSDEGVVVGMSSGGVTDIIVKYGDQVVRCKVRVR